MGHDEVMASEASETSEFEQARVSKMARYTRWVLPVVLAVEVVLILTGVLRFSDGVAVVIAVEATLALVVIAELLAMRRAVKRAKARGMTLFEAFLAALPRILPKFAVRVVRHDLIMWRSIWLTIRGKQDVAADGAVIHYSAQLRPMFWVFFCINPLEIALVELAIPSPTVRAVLLALGILSTIWFFAFIMTLYKYPHTIDPRKLRVRYSAFHDYSVPVAKIESVRLGKETWQVKKSCEVVDGVLVMEIHKTTNVSVLLGEPLHIELGKHGIKEISRVALWADDPNRAIEQIRQRLGDD
jgi:hypothetical protein